MDFEVAPCKYCSKPTPMQGTKLCDHCWGLENLISRDPDLAYKIVRIVMEKKHATNT